MVKLVVKAKPFAVVGNTGYGLVANGSLSAICGTLSGTVECVSMRFPRKTRFKNLLLALTEPPGLGKSWTLTLYVDDEPSSLAATVSGELDTLGQDIIHTVDVFPGQRVYYCWIGDGVPCMAHFGVEAMFIGGTWLGE